MSKEGLEVYGNRLRKLPTATVYDVMDGMGLGEASCLSNEIQPLARGSRLVGPAFTFQWVRDPRSRTEWNPQALPTIADYFTGITEGDVVVVDGGDDRSTGQWGEMLSTMAKMSGAVGAIVDGGTRDSEGILDLEGFEVFARYTSPIESVSRLRVHATSVPLLLDGALGGRVLVRPGDWVLGDADGVLILPAERLEEIIAASEELDELEERTRDDLLAGADFNEVFDKYGRA